MPPGGMLGADLDSMAALGSQLDTTTGEIGDVSGDAQRIATTVVDEMRQTFDTAVTQINTAMEQLNASVQRMVTQTDTTDWTGVNRDTFVDASAQFDQSTRQVAEETDAAYKDFDSHSKALGESLEQFQSTLTTNLTNASDSTQSMSTAVAAQAQALDTTMNTGLSLA